MSPDPLTEARAYLELEAQVHDELGRPDPEDTKDCRWHRMRTKTLRQGILTGDLAMLLDQQAEIHLERGRRALTGFQQEWHRARASILEETAAEVRALQRPVVSERRAA